MHPSYADCSYALHLRLGRLPRGWHLMALLGAAWLRCCLAGACRCLGLRLLGIAVAGLHRRWVWHSSNLRKRLPARTSFQSFSGPLCFGAEFGNTLCADCEPGRPASAFVQCSISV